MLPIMRNASSGSNIPPFNEAVTSQSELPTAILRSQRRVAGTSFSNLN